jgi:glycosyltransferase involved in cell wall biosynthesis
MTRRVVLLRGRQANPWDLRPWEDLGPEYEVQALVPGGNLYDTSLLGLTRVPVRTLSDAVPGGRAGDLAARALGERYLGLEKHLAGAGIVHAAELGYWFSWQAARLRARLGFKLVLTVWETLPFLDAYRNVRTRRYRREVLAAADLFLATTERARDALLLEGAPPERVRVSGPGIDVDRFAVARTPVPPEDGGHLVLSVGRLVWEKGHQDLLRALAELRRAGRDDVRGLIVGQGPEEGRLRRYASDLGLDGVVRFAGSAPYEEMAGFYARASCLVLASIPIRYWEEQFGMVLIEAMAAHLPIVASSSGAIPEVVGGSGTLFAPGDWRGLADVLAHGPLAGPPAARRAPEPGRLEGFSSAAAAERLAAAYDSVSG